MENKNKPIEVKIITLGNTHVGKSSLIVKFIENKFSISYMSTIGFDVKFKSIRINDEEVKITIHDTAGQERFRALAVNYIKQAQGILLVYDITDEKSFEEIGNWMNNKKKLKINYQLYWYKCDLKDERKVPKVEGEKIAKNYNMTFFETSCKNGDNVEKGFRELAQKIIERKKQNQKNPTLAGKKLEKEKEQKKKDDCCLKK